VPDTAREIDHRPAIRDSDRVHRADPLALPAPDARRRDHAGPGGVRLPEPPGDGEVQPPLEAGLVAGVGGGSPEVRDREVRRVISDRPDGRGIDETAGGRIPDAPDIERVYADEAG